MAKIRTNTHVFERITWPNGNRKISREISFNEIPISSLIGILTSNEAPPDFNAVIMASNKNETKRRIDCLFLLFSSAFDSYSVSSSPRNGVTFFLMQCTLHRFIF